MAAYPYLTNAWVPRSRLICCTHGVCIQVKAPAKREAVFGKFSYAHNFLPHMVEHDIKVNGKNAK